MGGSLFVGALIAAELAVFIPVPAQASAETCREEELFRVPPGMTFHRRPSAAPAQEPVPAPLEGGIDAREGEEFHCGHIRAYADRASAEQMTCIRRTSRSYIESRGNVHFPEDTCDSRARTILEGIRSACGYRGAFLMLWNREDIGRQDGLTPGIPGAIDRSVEWGVHFVGGVVDQDGLCWTLDPALGRDQGGVVAFREHLALTDHRGRAALVQVSRWNVETAGQGEGYGLCMADCLGTLNRRLLELGPRHGGSLDDGLSRAGALGTCIGCSQECGRRYEPVLFKYSCEQVFYRSRGSDRPAASGPKS